MLFARRGRTLAFVLLLKIPDFVTAHNLPAQLIALEARTGAELENSCYENGTAILDVIVGNNSFWTC